MSFYATIQGEITYPNQTRLDEVVAKLTERHWMKDRKLVDEDGSIVSDSPKADVDGLTLRIPLGYYRNLARQLDEMTKGCESADVAWTSTDGCFTTGVYEGGKETTYNLTRWARDNMEPEDQSPPDVEADSDAYCAWMSRVETEFHSDFA